MTENIRNTIGRYELIRTIGRGSQGCVFLAHDPTLDRPVAIKLLTATGSELAPMADDGTPIEARISGKLRHPNIIPIFDAGVCQAGPFLVFEYVEGKPLAQLLKDRGALPIEEAVPLVAAILAGITAAHASDIAHLDLSPRNVLMDKDDRPRVMDFGLGQYISRVREPGKHAAGTLRYMAPEHFQGKPLGPWTDVFALGSSFFEIVTGQRAMQGTSIRQIQEMIVSGQVRFSLLKPLLHGPAFSRFLVGALETSLEGRYADASIMSQAFELFLEETGLAESTNAGASNHSTIDFLLRRMQRTGDFPTISRTLIDINRLTGENSGANADKLAKVILRDFALTGKLLKLVNSSFYGLRSGEITSVSQAVVLLGVEKLRMTANSMTFFGQMKKDSAVLRDSMTRSFLAGLVARHLAQRAKLPGTEEAFICGMYQNLGETLVIFYFADEFEDICQLQLEEGLDKHAAARGVLGVTYPELGAAVARIWNLPGTIVDSIRGLPPGQLGIPETDEEKLRDIAVFANELCNLFQQNDAAAVDGAMATLAADFFPSVSLQPSYCEKLIAAGLEKLRQYAPIFEINVAASQYCSAVHDWLERERPGEEDIGHQALADETAR